MKEDFSPKYTVTLKGTILISYPAATASILWDIWVGRIETKKACLKCGNSLIRPKDQLKFN